nr:unnamed protein product [Callosobruchus chinensis]
MACAKADLDFAALEKDIVKKFVCPTCFHHIRPPIKQCMAGHIYCSNCFNILIKCWLCPAPKSNIRCSTLDKLHSLLNFPCKGYRKGCTFTGKSSVIDDHEKSCKYTAVSCPARGTGCSWVGNVSEIIPHLAEDHPANFSVSSEQDLKWNRYMERNRMHAHIFNAYGNLFRLTWMMDDKGLLRFGLFRMGGAVGRTRWSYRIMVSHATKSGCSISYIEPVRYLMDGGREEEWSDLWTSLDPWCWMRYCDDDDDLRLSASQQKDADDRTLARFSCPTCSNYILGPIITCYEGHYFCADCFREVCSLCGSETMGGRTTMLEKVQSTVTFPCKYAEKDVSVHEVSCWHSQTSCPLKHIGCGWKGQEREVIDHCYNDHPNDTFQTMSQEFQVQHFNTFEEKKVFLLFNGYKYLFRFNWELDRKTDTFMVAIYFLGTPPLHLMFDYEISFSSKPKPGYEDSRITVRGPVPKLLDDTFVFISDKYTKLKLEQLRALCDDEGTLHYTVDIFCSSYFD